MGTNTNTNTNNDNDDDDTTTKKKQNHRTGTFQEESYRQEYNSTSTKYSTISIMHQ